MKNKNILVIGGANIEYILKSKLPIVQGSKNFVEIEELFGGSGVNYSLRLLHYEERVIPLLFVGDDSTGEQIYAKFAPFGIDKEKFFVPALQTPRSTIIVEGTHRTILSQDANKINIFQPFLQQRCKEIATVGAVIIGHIHNDRKEINQQQDRLSSLYILEYFKSAKETLVYANFGASQLEYGFDFWKTHLCKIDIFQLNIYELRVFLDGGQSCNLACLIQKIQDLGIHMIITLDQFGAIGIMKGDKKRIFMARPINDTENFVDSTGAGDAFCAGMVSVLKGDKNFSQAHFMKAMERGRSWASYACNSYGGANNCPSKEQITRYHDEKSKDNAVVVYHDEAMRDLIALMDSMLKK